MPVKTTSALLDVRYTSLRQPYDSYTSLTERPGYLRLYGQESLNSCYNVSLVARRQQERHVQVETCVEFTPTCREQMAGLAYMYDTGNFYLLVKTREEEFGSQTLDLKKPAKLRLIKSDHFDVEDVIPATADESFADFFYNFASDADFQRTRIVFPISMYKGTGVVRVSQKDWTYDPLFSREQAYTVLFDHVEDMEMEKDTAVHSVQVDEMDLSKRLVKRYYFERIKNVWFLEAIN